MAFFWCPFHLLPSGKVRPLFEELGVSTVLVVGGSGDFFTVADAVIMMDERRGQVGAWKVCGKYPTWDEGMDHGP